MARAMDRDADLPALLQALDPMASDDLPAS